MPPRRDFQPLTVESASSSRKATSPVPPKSSMISSGVDAMPSSIVRTVRTCQGYATGETTFSQKHGAIAPVMDSNTVIAGRLKAIRKELGMREGMPGGYSQTQFADKLGLTKSTYNPFETGNRTLTFETACLIRRRFGVPIDWLFFGEMPKIDNEVLFKLGPEPIMPVRAKRTAAGK
jgi:transcriptional regulator with XRE-family HTH domain